MTIEEVKKMIEEDEDYVYLKRFGYSLDKVIERYPDGAPNHVIASAMMLTEDDVEFHYQKIVHKLRGLMGVET